MSEKINELLKIFRFFNNQTSEYQMEMIYIAHFLEKMNVVLTVNNNGIFFDLRELESEKIDKLYNFINNIIAVNKHIESGNIEDKKQKLIQNYFSVDKKIIDKDKVNQNKNSRNVPFNDKNVPFNSKFIEVPLTKIFRKKRQRIKNRKSVISSDIKSEYACDILSKSRKKVKIKRKL